MGAQNLVSRAWAWLLSFRRRIVFRAVFAFLALSIVLLALMLLGTEKQRIYQNYQGGLSKTHAQILSRLTHPAGQLALINAGRAQSSPLPLRPYVLPYAALDYDDVNKVQQAVDTAGCYVVFDSGQSVCVAIGNNPWAGGFVYIAGRFTVGTLVSRQAFERQISGVHRFRIAVNYRVEQSVWMAPYERMQTPAPSRLSPETARGIRGRLTGFLNQGDQLGEVNPVRDFRGWIWQSARCVDGSLVQVSGLESDCERSTFFSIRLPIKAFEMALFASQAPQWPPADLGDLKLRVEILGPSGSLFDSNLGPAKPPFSLQELSDVLQPGEVLDIRRKDGANPTAGAPIATIKGLTDGAPVAPWIENLVSRLPLGLFDGPNELPLAVSGNVSTASSSYVVSLRADARAVQRSLASAATRMSWFVAAMLAAVLIAWVIIEVGFISRMRKLHVRSRQVIANDANKSDQLVLDLRDLRGKDELGSLAVALDTLLVRVQQNAERDKQRAEHERETWQAVGHEIMSPLQSLMVLHSAPDDPSARYIQRMTQAIKVLYGQASPSEAFTQSIARLEPLNLSRFLDDVAANAPDIGIANVSFESSDSQVTVSADPYMLEDVITHILQNAQRYRTTGTNIVVEMRAHDNEALISISNSGPRISDAMIDRVFEYGVSDPSLAAGPESKNRGQGLFVVKTYMAKMGGSAKVSNTPDGVRFILRLSVVRS